MADTSYYDLLGVARDADTDAIKSAFRKAAMKYHPDRNPDDPAAEARFKEVNEAYSVLSNPETRARYDRFGKAGVSGGPSGGPSGAQDMADALNEMFGDVFSDFFGGGGGGRQRNTGPARGADLRYDIEVTLEDAYAGKDLTINAPVDEACARCESSGAEPGTKPETCGTCGGVGQVRMQQGFFTLQRTCPRCNGRGQIVPKPCKSCDGRGVVKRDRQLGVRVPAGVEDGMRIRLQGEGEKGPRGGPPGDLYLFVSISPHDIFERDGTSLFCRAPVEMTTAALGGQIELPTLDGELTPLDIPEGTQTGRRLHLKGKGMPRVRGAGPLGDLTVEIYVETPRNLNARQKQLLREFGETCEGRQHPESAGFFDKVRRFFDT
jgi:molecular chaperone DnaJ